MSQSLQRKRLLMLALLVVAAFAGLGYRLVDLQVLNPFEHQRIAQQNTERTVLKKPHRGNIRAVRGELLATSIPAVTVCADPSLLEGRHVEMAKVLAPVLKLNVRQLAERMQPRIHRYETNDGTVTPIPLRYVRLKQKVGLEEWQQVRAALTNATFGLNPALATKPEKKLLHTLRTVAVMTEEDAIRFYPGGRLAAHVLGYTADDDASGSLVGRDGIEWSLNDQLTGVAGWREIERDGKGRELVPYRRQDVEARDGYDVHLTLDAVLQQVLETELATASEKFRPKNITGIMVRPRTGEILALANLPNFDPNLPGASTDDSRRNRVIADIVEPGSTFKITVVAGALSDGVVTLRDIFDCEHGAFKYGGRVLHDHDPYGLLTVEQIITKSSNIGAAKVGIQLGPEALYRHIRAFGFGSRTMIPLQGEVFGIVHQPKNWNKVSIAQIPMGHGISVTRLQMLMAMAALANDGVLMQPMLVDRIVDRSGRTVAQYTPQKVRQVVSPEAARQMVQALKTVTTKEGTAPKAALEHYSVAGKTGTAQKVKPKEEGGGYYTDRFISSFIGFLPADDPQICISIVLDDPSGQYYGGQCAAPVFRNVAERAASYLNLKPDLGEPMALTAASNPADTNGLRASVPKPRQPQP
jgi:cell division protein FtsI/penicillin-binding protein 2